MTPPVILIISNFCVSLVSVYFTLFTKYYFCNMSESIYDQLLKHKNETRKRINSSSNRTSTTFSKSKLKRARKLGLRALQGTEGEDNRV